MNKSDIVEALTKETGISKAKATTVVDLFFDEMSDALANGDRVEIRGLFSMFVKEYKAYTGRNPKTKEAVLVPAKKLPFFRCGKELGERVDRRLYFAYGSNMDLAQMDDRCPGAILIGVRKLPAHCFRINGRGVATVVPDQGGAKDVYGVLWDITKEHEKTLDDKEGVKYGTYRKDWITVETEKGNTSTALIYIAAEDTQGHPRDGYMEKIVAAAEHHGLSPKYLGELKIWLPS